MEQDRKEKRNDDGRKERRQKRASRTGQTKEVKEVSEKTVTRRSDTKSQEGTEGERTNKTRNEGERQAWKGNQKGSASTGHVSQLIPASPASRHSLDTRPRRPAFILLRS